MSKIALPAHVMEPRSAIEVFSDLVRPDLLVAIAQGDSKVERMESMLKAFLGGFLQMRGLKNYARKPFNPVQGEFFRCVWTVPDAEKAARKTKRIKPITKMNYHENDSAEELEPEDALRGTEIRLNRATGMLDSDDHGFNLIGEQVSHHPPVTALYAECKAASMSVHGRLIVICFVYNFTLLVSFLGSVQVKAEPDFRFSFSPLRGVKIMHVGKIVVNDGFNEETYSLPLPNAYASNVMEIPQLDFTGDILINSSNGMTASVKFLDPKEERFRIACSIKVI